MNSLRPINSEMLNHLEQVRHLRLLYPQSWKPMINPHANAARKAATTWFHEVGLVSDERSLRILEEERVDLYAGYPYPTANFEQLVTLAEFLALWVLFDDLVTENPDNYWQKQNLSFDDYMVALRGGPLSPRADGFLRAWWQVCQRFSRMSDRWRNRLADRYAEWLQSTLEERRFVTELRDKNVPSALERYLDIRTYSIGAMPTFYFIEYCEGFELPEEVRRSEGLRALHILGSRLIFFVNDIISLERDLQAEWPNSVTLLQRTEGLSLADAVQRVTELHNRAVFQFLEVERKLPPFAPEVQPFVEVYVRLMHFVIRGLAEFQMGAERYRWKDMLAPGRSPVTISLTSFTDENAV